MAKNKMPGITIEGDKELHAMIASLPNRQISAASVSMRRAAKPIVQAAKRNLTKGHGVDTGLLKRSIGVRHLKAIRKESKVVMYIGPRFNYQSGDGKRKHVPWRIAHLVEFGHVIAKGGKIERRARSGRLYPGTGVVTGNVAPRPFLRPAVDANKTNFLSELKAGLRKEIEKRIRKGEVNLFIPAWQGERKGGDL